MAVANWTTETTTDPATGKTTVTVTVADAQSRRYQTQWVSGAPAAVAPSLAGTVAASNVALGNADVLAEQQVAGTALLAAVNAGDSGCWGCGGGGQSRPDRGVSAGTVFPERRGAARGPMM